MEGRLEPVCISTSGNGKANMVDSELRRNIAEARIAQGQSLLTQLCWVHDYFNRKHGIVVPVLQTHSSIKSNFPING